MLSRGLLVLAGLTMVIAVVGCTRSHPKPNFSTVSPTPSATASPSASATPTAVPVDQIPPGNPASWVPTGVPTTAPFKEPGDVLPTFTPVMFTKTQEGALAMAKYYLDARNWALATNNPASFMIICDAEKCKHDAPFFTKYANARQHAVGDRGTPGPPTAFKAPSGSRAEVVVQTTVRHAAGRVVDSKGTVVHTDDAFDDPTNLFLKWTGKMWRVTGHFLVG
jgi:hypothetical protein